MKKYDSRLYKRKIIMISDYAEPETYSGDELENEKMLLEKFHQEIYKYNIPFVYEEFKKLDQLTHYLKKLNKDEVIIFNWCEEVDGIENSGHRVTQLLENNNFIFTGGNSENIITTTDKILTKDILIKNNVKTPDYIILNSEDDLDNKKFIKDNVFFPSIVKLAYGHCSAGITNENIVYTLEQLEAIASKMFIKYSKPLLIERFIEGDEYAVPVWGNNKNVEILPISEITFKNNETNKIQTEASKFNYLSDEFNNTVCSLVDNSNQNKIIKSIFSDIQKAYIKLDIHDYARFELRQSKNVYYIIDVNVNPALCLDGSLFEGSKMLGYNAGETILKICEFSLLRNI